jgi:hypothetical protein
MALAAAVGAAGAADPRARPRPALDVDVGKYGSTDPRATVTGRAYEERRRPSASDTPIVGASVVLLPRSETLLARLAALKAGARDSTGAYRKAFAGMREAANDLEQALRDADAGRLVSTATTDPAGRFTLHVPPGDWVLLVWKAAFVDTPSSVPPRRERQMYRLEAPLEGYRAVDVWMREVSVRGAGARESYELTDRNVWFSGVEEVKKRVGAGR